MADIWNGAIVLPDGSLIKDVGLSSQNVASSPALSAASLRFLSAVDTARIPLYLAAGPSLDVWTTCEDTEAWFESILLSKPAVPDTPTAARGWWQLMRSQSPIGILVQVQSEDNEPHKPGVTEVLFYGTVAAPATGLPTPPSSSPHLHDRPEHLPELRVHALPLSSHLLYHHQPEPLEDGEAQFLPQLQDSQVTPLSPKRKRDLFEEATIANKKARGRGGKSVATAAARATESQQPYSHRKSLSIDTKASPFPDNRPQSAHSALPHSLARPLSRSPSISSDTRPLSRKGTFDPQSKRSTLSRVATAPLPSEEPTTESRNKDALSKVVMAAMRMHGLQQRKKDKSKRASLAPGVDESHQTSEDAAREEVSKDDDFKLIYHQTFKGAAFALRMHMLEKPLHAQPDLLRDIVEKFLTIFLTDPLTEPLPSNDAVDPVATPGSKIRLAVPCSTNGRASPFDLPSSSRPAIRRSVTDTQVYTGSPVSRRRTETT